MTRVFVIVPCGSRKVWDENPSAGPTPAADAYIGPLFKKNKAYARRFATDWMILSAKYGLIPPSFTIPGPYDVSFKKPSTHPIAPVEVAGQAARIDFADYDVVIGLGGKEYREIVAVAFRGARIEFPFRGLKIGLMMQAINVALDTGQMFPRA